MNKLQPSPQIEALTKRELEVLQQLAAGRTNREIGEELLISLHTVKWYVKQIFRKLQVQRRTEAAAVARAWGLLEEPGRAASHSSAPTASYPATFVGREQELAQLDQFLAKTLAGSSQVIFVTGEAGSGKSALVHTFLQRAQVQYPRLIAVSGQCNAFTGIGDPYLPFCEMLALLTGNVQGRRQAGALEPMQIDRLTALLPETIQILVEHGASLLTTLLDGQSLLKQIEQSLVVNHTKRAQLKALLTEGAAAMSPVAGTQQRLFTEVTNVLQHLAQQRPLLLVLDDLQWSDLGSLNLLFHLSRELVDVPILIVGIYRNSDVALGRNGERHPLLAVVNELQRRFGEQCIELGQTSDPVFVNALLDTLPNCFSPEFRFEFHEHTRGHALFSVEMLRSLQERGDLVRNDQGQWQEGSSLNWEILPARVEAVIAERMDRLPQSLLELLTVAGIEGEAFTAEVAAQVLAMDERTIISHLETELGREHRLVYAQDIRRFKERRVSRYRFRHHLFQHYLYTRLHQTQRAYLHEDVGLALEAFYADDRNELTAIAGNLARHFLEAGNYSKAIHYLQLAGDRAMVLSAHHEAIDHFTQAVTLLDRLPHCATRDQQELTLQLRIAAQLMIVRGHSAPEIEGVYARARELSLGMDAPRTQEYLSTLYMLWTYYLIRGQMPPSRELAERIRDLSKSTSDGIFHLTAHWALGVTLLHGGELTAACSHLEQLITLSVSQEYGDLAYTRALDPKAAGLFWLARTLWNLGYPDQARQRGQEAVAHARRLDHPHTLIIALTINAWVHFFCGQWQTAKQLTVEAIALSIEYSMPQLQGLATFLHGSTLVALGHTTTGMAELSRGHAMHSDTGSHLGDPYFLGTKATVYGILGDLKKGLQLISEAMTTSQQSGEYLWDAELHQIKGELLLQQCRESVALGNESTTQAKTCFLQAIKIAQQQQARSCELRATMSLARLLQHQGEHRKAKAQLAEIYGWFTEGFSTKDLQDAQALLKEIECQL